MKAARDPVRPRPPRQLEAIEQAALVRWSHKSAVRALMPALRWLHHSPNGGKRDSFVGGQMRSLGAKKGFPDLILPVRSGDHPGLVIEMKSPNGRGRLSEEQFEWLAHFREQGWMVEKATTCYQGRDIICAYFGLDPAKVPPLDQPQPVEPD